MRTSVTPARRVGVTIATAAALSLGATAVALPASAADAPATKKVKVVKIVPKAFPKLLDRPGASADVLRFTRVAGAVWKVGDIPVKFEGTNKTADVPAADAVTVVPEADTATNTFAISGPTTWNYTATNTAKTYTKADVEGFLTWSDLPGTKNDSVTLARVNGIVWDVAGVTYDETKFGAKTSLVVKLKAGDKVKPVAVGATFANEVPTELTGVTDAATITHTADKLMAAAKVGDNPFDATKGVGKGASVETVKITGLAGVSWKVGSSPKAVNVKPGVTSYVAVPTADLDGTTTTVNVTPVPAAGFAVPKTETGVTPVTLEFKDDSEAPKVTVGAAVPNDNSGTVADTLVLPAKRGMSWFVGQTDAKGKLTYKALKPGKDGNAVYKVKHGKDGKGVEVRYRAVPDRGYTVSDRRVKTMAFTADQKSVDTPALLGGSYTLTAATEGVASWTVTGPVNDKEVKNTFKPSDLKAAGATSMTIPGTAIVVKLVKGYKAG